MEYSVNTSVGLVVNPREQAAITALHVENEMRSGGGTHALKRLEESVDVALQSHADTARHQSTTNTQAYRSEYMKSLNEELLTRGLLPELAVAHGLTVVASTCRSIKQSELFEIRDIQRFIAYGKHAEIAHTLTSVFKQLYHEIKLEHSDKTESWWPTGSNAEPDEVTWADLDSYLRNRHEERRNMTGSATEKTPEQIANFKIAQALLLKVPINRMEGIGHRFDGLDTAAVFENAPDGKIGRTNVEELLRRATGPDKNLFQFVYDNWNSEQVKLLRDGDYITRNSLVHGTGYPNITELRKDIWNNKKAVCETSRISPRLLNGLCATEKT